MPDPAGQTVHGDRLSSRRQYGGWAWVEPFHCAPSLVQARRKRVFDVMEKEGIDALLLLKPDNIRYVTDFPVKGYRPFMELEYACVLPMNAEPRLGYSSGSDEGRLDRYGPIEKYHKLDLGRGWTEALVDLLEREGLSSARLGTDLLPYEVADRLQQKLPNVELIAFADRWSQITAIKSEEEVGVLRQAVAIAEQGMRAAVETIADGETELEVSARAEYAMRAAGSEVSPFIPVVASGANAAIYERIATHKNIASGEVVMLDLGCVFKGYTAEYARTVSVGKPTVAQKRAWGAVQHALEVGIGALKVGMSCANVDHLVRKALEEAGYGAYQHRWATGHQVGFGLHGEPAISPSSTAVIEAGMVINLEPGLYLADQPEIGGITIEETILVTEEGPEILTQTPRGLVWM